MAKNPDYTALAQAYMQLMQQQMSEAMTHPQMVESLLSALTLMDPRRHAGHERAAAAASGAGDDAIVRLEQRVDRIESQLAELLSILSATAAPTQSIRTKPSKSAGRHATSAGRAGAATSTRPGTRSGTKATGRSTKSKRKPR